jgi:hypothetical protein
MSRSPSTSTADDQDYFNIFITGLGYLNRIRTVNPPKGEPFLACTIAALNGPSSQPDKVYFDCKVVGAKAQELVLKCEDAVKANRKVLTVFRLGDPWIDQYIYKSGKKQGQTGTSFKTRLLHMSMIKIDGKLVYQADDERGTDESSDEGAEDRELPAKAA